MADDFLSPIIDEFVTILQAKLPGEIDDLDTNLENIPNEFMHKAMMQYHLQYPSMEIFAEESIFDPNFTTGITDFNWRIITSINITAKDEETGELDMHKYMTAVIKAIDKGTGSNTFSLNGVVRKCGAISVNFVGVGEPGNILFSLFIVWDILVTKDSLAGV